MSGEASILILLVLAAQWLCGRLLKPRWRCALWLLVLLRLTLPWTISSPASLFNILKMPAAAPHVRAEPIRVETINAPIEDAQGVATVASSASVKWLAWLWAIGALLLTGCAVITQCKFRRRVSRLRPLTDGTTLSLLEDCKALMGVSTPVSLVETEAINSPTLFGFVRPRLLLPKGLVSSFTREELRHVFLHELAHIQRHDILTGWVALGLQIVHWFNPLVWLAFYRLRADRELACDALALSYARTGENESYGLTIVKLLEGFGQPLWGPSLAGILENKQQMKERINMIAKFHKTDRGLALAVALLVGLTLITMTDAQTGKNTPASEPNSPPHIVATSPTVGETGVDPAITEITVTFDRDMAKGYSWVGGGPDYPPTVGKPEWHNKRTCVLPVRLEAAHYYWVGINSRRFQNFRSAAGVPATPSAIYFTTQGASEELQKQMVREAAIEAQNQTQPQPAKISEPDATKGVWAVRFEPVGDFSPKTPSEFLARIPVYSGQHGEIGYFRTKKQGDKLVGSFLAYDPDQLKAALSALPGIKVTSVEKLTQEELIEYEKSPQESLIDFNQELDVSKGVWAVRFEPVGDFSPKTPGEFLARIPVYSGQDGEIGYFRTTKQGDRLIGSFLAYDPDQLRKALAAVPGIKVTSVEKLTQEQLVVYEKSPQESLSPH